MLIKNRPVFSKSVIVITALIILDPELKKTARHFFTVRQRLKDSALHCRVLLRDGIYFRNVLKTDSISEAAGRAASC
jgi:hypothetical protein